MKERPILFKGEMVRAILAGDKTQTRRAAKSPAKNMQAAGAEVIKNREPGDKWYGDRVWSVRGKTGVWGDYTHDRLLSMCPYGQPGDRLWVRETWSGEYWLSCVKPSERISVAHPSDLKLFPPKTWYWADGEPDYGDWEKPRPSIHMPRWASRIILEITDVRVERLQDISYCDAEAEGMYGAYGNLDTGVIGNKYGYTTIQQFRDLWKKINGNDSWDANPWVWVVEFRRIEP